MLAASLLLWLWLVPASALAQGTTTPAPPDHEAGEAPRPTVKSHGHAQRDHVHAATKNPTGALPDCAGRSTAGTDFLR